MCWGILISILLIIFSLIPINFFTKAIFSSDNSNEKLTSTHFFIIDYIELSERRSHRLYEIVKLFKSNESVVWSLAFWAPFTSPH